MEQKYYLVLAEVSIFQTVWLIPREDGSIGWTDEIKQAKPFSSYEEAKNKTEAHMQSVFEFIASYKINKKCIFHQIDNPKNNERAY